MTTSPSRVPALLATVGLLAVITAACGATGTSGEAGGTPTAVPPAAGACLEGAEDCRDDGGHEPEPGQAMQVEPTDGLDDVHARGWDTIEVDPADQTRVTVYWWSGVAPCHVLADVEVSYRDDAVTLTVLEGSEPADEPQACIELAQYTSTSLTLDEAIGPRSIVDGAEA